MNETNGTFTRWMLSVTATITVAMVGGIFTVILSLKEDMAHVKSEVDALKANDEAMTKLQTQVQEHDIRIRWIEQGTIDYQSQASWRRGKARQDTITNAAQQD